MMQGRELRVTSHELVHPAGSRLLAIGSKLLPLWMICLGTSVFAQRSPFNNLEVLPADSNGHYRIIIGGHFHGESTNRSGYPAATLLANIDTINSLGANLFLSTGDLFMDPVNDLPRYQKAFFSKLKMPFFNAPGNHDVGDSESSRGAYYVPLSRCTSERLAEAPDVPSGTTLSDNPGRSWDYRSPIECLFLDTELSGGITAGIFRLRTAGKRRAPAPVPPRFRRRRG